MQFPRYRFQSHFADEETLRFSQMKNTENKPSVTGFCKTGARPGNIFFRTQTTNQNGCFQMVADDTTHVNASRLALLKLWESLPLDDLSLAVGSFVAAQIYLKVWIIKFSQSDKSLKN